MANELSKMMTKKLSVKKYTIKYTYANGKSWSSPEMTLEEVAQEIGESSLTQNEYISAVKDLIRVSKKNLKKQGVSKVELIVMYDYVNGQWSGEDTLWSSDLKECTLESLSQEIGGEYNKLSKDYGVDLNALVNEFMQTKYPEGLPDFAGDIIYSRKYWKEFEDWYKEKFGKELNKPSKTYNERPANLKEAKSKLDALLPDLVDLLTKVKGDIEDYGVALANGNVPRPQYKDFATRFVWDTYYALKRVYKYNPEELNADDINDTHIETLLKTAFKKSGISIREEDYKGKELEEGCSKKLKEGFIGQTVQDFTDLWMNNFDEIVLFDYDLGEDPVYRGDFDEIPEEMLEADFHDFDCVNLNVNVSEESDGDQYYSTLEEFLDDYNTGDSFTVWSMDTEDTIYQGYREDCPEEVLEMPIVSFDCDQLSLNVTLTDSDFDYDDDEDDYDDSDIDDYEEDDIDENLNEEKNGIEVAKEMIDDLVKEKDTKNENLDNKSNENNAKLNESAKIISDLSDYKPWSGAVDLWNEIVDANKIDLLDFTLEDLYPEGITMTQLNDLLWFDGDWVREMLGLNPSYSDED